MERRVSRMVRGQVYYGREAVDSINGRTVRRQVKEADPGECLDRGDPILKQWCSMILNSTLEAETSHLQGSEADVTATRAN